MNTKTITINAPAKINLFFDVLSRRPDGYHDIKSIMQTVSLYDTLSISIKEAEKTSIILHSTAPSLPTGSGNIAYRAAEIILNAVKAHFYVEIEIVKRIPVAAGLAGGSTDAAAVLTGINRLLGNRLSISELCSLGASLGADVPFCILKGTKIALGKGEILTDCTTLPDTFILISTAGEPVRTPAAYGILDDIYNNFSGESHINHTGYAAMQEGLKSGKVTAICSSLYNIFEDAILPSHSKVGKIKAIMQNSGAVGTLMSGSGPSVFAIFDSETKIRSAAEALTSQGITAHICRPVFS